MAVPTETVALSFLNIVADTPIDCNMPAFSEDDIEVIYGLASLQAILNTDFTVDLSPPNFNNFTVTPTAALLTKINNLIAADDTETNSITVRRQLGYTTSNDQSNVHSTLFLSQELDRTAMRFQQIAEQLKRAITLSPKNIGGVIDPIYVDAPVDGAVAVWSGNTLTNGPALGDVPVLVQEAQDAEAGTAANLSATQSSAAAAANSAAIAQAAASGMLWQDVVFLTHADSPKTLTAADRSKLFVCDTSAGAITINLMSIAPLVTPPAFTIGIQKSTADVNAVTVVRNGTDVFEGGGTTYVFPLQFSGATLIADTTPAPDQWAVLPFAPVLDSRVGFMEDFGGTVVPAGTLECDGSAVLRATYASLFAAIGTTHGVGDGATTFNLPNKARRVSVGRGGAGTATLGNAVGNTGGEEAHTMLGTELVPHDHSYDKPIVVDNNGPTSPGTSRIGISAGQHTSSTGTGDPFNVMQPSLVVMSVIRYR